MICCTCRQDLPASEYSPDHRSPRGLQRRCKGCYRISTRAARAANPEKKRARDRAYHAANREMIRAINARSRARNKEKIRERKRLEYLKVRDNPDFKARIKAYQDRTKAEKAAYDRFYRQSNPEKVRAKAAQWLARNWDKRLATSRNYKGRRRAAETGGISTRELAQWFKAAGRRCFWCDAADLAKPHVDHFMPLAKGGAHTADNLVIACGPCNLKKNAKLPEEYAQILGPRLSVSARERIERHRVDISMLRAA